MISIFKCFQTKDIGEREEIEIKPPVKEEDKLNILLLPGHAPLRGANTYVTYLNEAEWNRDVVDKVQEVYGGKHNLFKFKEYRKVEETYKEYCKRIAKFCREYSIDLVIEQHLNAAGVPEARGCEMLIPSGHAESAYFANLLALLFSTHFEIVLRGNYNNRQGVKPLKKGQRGSFFVHEIVKQTKGKTAVFLMEPFFCDYRTGDSSKFLDEPDHGIGKMVNFYRKFLLAI